MAAAGRGAFRQLRRKCCCECPSGFRRLARASASSGLVMKCALNSGAARRQEAASLKRLNATVFIIIQSTVDRLVETACGEVGLNAGVNGLRAVLVKP